VPQRRTLTSVLVPIAQARGDEPSGGSLRLGIRAGTFDGPLLAWTVAHVDVTPEAPTWKRIQLPAPVAVTPNATYVLELSSTEKNLMLYSSGGSPDDCLEAHYEPGDPIAAGQPDKVEDFLFATYGGDSGGVGAMEVSWQGPEGLCGTVWRDVRLAGRVVAQTFTASGAAIGALAVQLYADGPDTGLARLTAELYDDAAETPALARASLTLAAPIGTSAWYIFELPSRSRSAQVTSIDCNW